MCQHFTGCSRSKQGNSVVSKRQKPFLASENFNASVTPNILILSSREACLHEIKSPPLGLLAVFCIDHNTIHISCATVYDQIEKNSTSGKLPFLFDGLNPSEKYESQLGWLFPIYGKIKHGNQTTNQFCIFPIAKAKHPPHRPTSLAAMWERQPPSSWEAFVDVTRPTRLGLGLGLGSTTQHRFKLKSLVPVHFPTGHWYMIPIDLVHNRILNTEP